MALELVGGQGRVPLSSSNSPAPLLFRFLVQLLEYGIPDPCCQPMFPVLTLLAFQWFYTLSCVPKHEYEPPWSIFHSSLVGRSVSTPGVLI